MRKIIKVILLSLLLSFFASNIFAFVNGEVRVQDEKQVAWNEESKQWINLEEFWRDYAKKNGGLTWGQSKTYPPYDDVKEHDLFLLEIKSGLCLMEFFHTRWRRANDVRRWDDKFNEYAGCAKVFD
jgi:hypothetical protein